MMKQKMKTLLLFSLFLVAYANIYPSGPYDDNRSASSVRFNYYYSAGLCGGPLGNCRKTFAGNRPAMCPSSFTSEVEASKCHEVACPENSEIAFLSYSDTNFALKDGNWTKVNDVPFSFDIQTRLFNITRPNFELEDYIPAFSPSCISSTSTTCIVGLCKINEGFICSDTQYPIYQDITSDFKLATQASAIKATVPTKKRTVAEKLLMVIERVDSLDAVTSSIQLPKPVLCANGTFTREDGKCEEVPEGYYSPLVYNQNMTIPGIWSIDENLDWKFIEGPYLTPEALFVYIDQLMADMCNLKTNGAASNKCAQYLPNVWNRLIRAIDYFHFNYIPEDGTAVFSVLMPIPIPDGWKLQETPHCKRCQIMPAEAGRIYKAGSDQGPCPANFWCPGGMPPIACFNGQVSLNGSTSFSNCSGPYLADIPKYTHKLPGFE